MEVLTFIAWETAKLLALIILAAIAGRGVWTLVIRPSWMKCLLLALILTAVGAGAWWIAHDVAAEANLWKAESNMGRGDWPQAYLYAQRAVMTRPNHRVYWRALIRAKLGLQQVQSALDDEPAMRTLGGGDLSEVDEYQFALCRHLLGQHDEVVAITQRLIRQDPAYADPYVLQGLTYTAEKKYQAAEQSFIALLQLFPSNQAAVEGLARVYYLAGDRQRALGVLAETGKYPFPEPVRRRFSALKTLYEQ